MLMVSHLVSQDGSRPFTRSPWPPAQQTVLGFEGFGAHSEL